MSEMRVFVAGDRSHVGKSSVCLTILAHLRERGEVAYIKPATQSEKGDTVSRWCARHKIRTAKSPLVFYPGFTRSVIHGTPVSLESIAQAVDDVCEGCEYCVIDGVGFPGVGSCVGASNAQIAAACRAPVVLVLRAGVGGALDAHCMNACLFEREGVPVLGCVLNRADDDGYYAKDKIQGTIATFFRKSRPRERCYGIVPTLDTIENARDIDDDDLAQHVIRHVAAHLDLDDLIVDATLDVFNRRRDTRRTFTTPARHDDRATIQAAAQADGAVVKT